MKRLIRKAIEFEDMNGYESIDWHDAYNRGAALAVINGGVYESEAHNGCMMKYLEEQGIDTNDFFATLSFMNGADEKIAFAHLVENPKMGEPVGIYLDVNGLKNLSQSEAVGALKEKYPSLDIYDEKSTQSGNFETIG